MANAPSYTPPQISGGNMQLALAALPAPFLVETRVVARAAEGAWHLLDKALRAAAIEAAPAPDDLAGALSLVASLSAGARRRLERALEAASDGLEAPRLCRPAGPDAKMLLTEGREALARSNERKAAKAVVGFSKFASAFADPEATIRLPDPGSSYDVEAVLVAVIGRATTRASAAEAARSVAGFTLMAEITDRTVSAAEARTRNNLFAKNRGGLSPLGPAVWLAGPRALDAATEVTLRVNGTERQRFAVGDLAHTAAACVKAWSRAGLVPGDLVGIGAAMALPRPGNAVDSPIPIAPGDAIEASSAPIGTLRAKVAG